MININLPEIHELKRYEYKDLPDTAGIYFIFDETDKLLYIGKTGVSIKQRIYSHVSKKRMGCS